MDDERLEASQGTSEGEFDLASFMGSSRAAESASSDAPPTTEAEPSQQPVQEPQAEPVPEVKAEAELQPEPTPAEPKHNAERSRLGREVKRLEAALEQQSQQMEILMQLMLTNADAQKAQPAQATVPEEDDFIPTTKQGMQQLFSQWLNQQVQQQQTQQTQYARGYFGALKTLGASENDTPDLVDEIVELCTKPGKQFHKYHTGNGQVDAQINFLAAKAHVLKSKIAKPEPKPIPLANQAPKAPLGDGPSSTASAKEAKLTRLPAGIRDSARNAAKHFGLSLSELGYEA